MTRTRLGVGVELGYSSVCGRLPVGQDPAIQERAQLALDEPRQEPRRVEGRALEEGREVLGEDAVEHGVLGLAAGPDRRKRGHVGPVLAILSTVTRTSGASEDSRS